MIGCVVASNSILPVFAVAPSVVGAVGVNVESGIIDVSSFAEISTLIINSWLTSGEGTPSRTVTSVSSEATLTLYLPGFS